MKKRRDISIVDLDEKKSLVLACDVSGGIGPKNGDNLKLSGEFIGRITTRVALMEVLAVGAEVISVIDTLSVEYDPTGKKIIRGIEQAIKEIGLNKKIINGSTEDNIKTNETGVGITVVGTINRDDLRISCSSRDDVLAAVGVPLVGEEVLENKNLAADIIDLQKLSKKNYVKEILPVGSKGIKYEAELMAQMSNLNLDYKQRLNLDLKKSAGPATVILLSLTQDGLLKLRNDFSNKPVNLIGKFK